MDAGMLNSLEDQIRFYLSYHQDKTNRLLHIISVPFLILTTLIFATYIPNPVANLAFIIVLLYIAYVAYLDSTIGLVFAPYAIALYLIAHAIHNNVPLVLALTLSVIVHVAAWVVQITGHLKFEKNKPALVNSLLHAVLAAPVVVYMEMLFSLGLLSETQARLEGARELQLNQTTMSSNTTPVSGTYGTTQS